MKKTLILISFILLSSIAGYSQTTVNGGVYSNTTWTKTNSPYIVTGNLVVFDGVTLNIQPGVVVKFNSGSGLELRGKLNAIGTVSDSIVFTSNSSSPAMNSWNGITATATANPLGIGDQVTMEYCKGLYAHHFINLDLAYHGPYIFRHCYFAYNEKVNHDGGMPSTIFENCRFVSNNTALGSCQFDSRVSNSFFINNINGVNGIARVDSCYFTGNTGVALSPYGSAVGCKIVNNNIGVSSYFNNTNNTFKNNIIANNAIGIEILSYFNGSITFTGNSICNNSLYNVKLLTQNNADLSNNCWCTTDQAIIRSKIYDGYVNTAYGLVNFSPVSNNCAQNLLAINKADEPGTLAPKIYPNPFSQSAIFEFNNARKETYELVIFDLKGKPVKTITNINSNKVELQRQNMAAGLYFYQLRKKDGIVSTGKFIIE